MGNSSTAAGTIPYWHDAIGERFGKLLADVDTLLLGRRTYVIHGEAFEPNPDQIPSRGRRSTSSPGR